MPGLGESDGLPGWWYALQGWQKQVFQREVVFFAHVEQSLVFTTGLKLSSSFICMSVNEV